MTQPDAFEAPTDAYCRFPTVHGDRVVFVAEDDLFHVDITGGTARRLTAGLGPFAMPRLSPDGRWVVVVAWEAGTADVYRMPADGGPLSRLTFAGGVSTVAGFLPDGRVVFSAHAKTAFAQAAELFAVPLDGGVPVRLPWGPARHIVYGPGSAVVLGRKTQELAYWKRYRGGTAGELWIDPTGLGHFTVFRAPNDGNLTDPMWVGDRIYFLSDFEGVGNLYSILPDGSDLRRHTDHDTYYARNAASDGQRIVYHAGGDLYVYDPKDDSARRIPVRVAGQRTQCEPKFVDPAPFLTDVAVHPTEEELTVTTRGHVYSLGFFEGPVHAFSTGSGVRQRLATYLGRSRRLLGVDDAGGAERIVIWDPDAAESPTVVVDHAGGLIRELQASPDGRRAAWTTDRGEVQLVEVGSRAVTRIETSSYGAPSGLAWSPDGRYLAYAMPVSPVESAIHVWAADDGQVHPVTAPVLVDAAPAWDPEGRYLYFLGARHLDPVYDQVTFDMGFPRATRPYVVSLRRDVPSPFLGAPPASGGASGQSGDGEPLIRIDFDGIAARVVPFPVPEGRYGQIAGLAGTVLWTTFPVRGELSGDLFANAPPADGQLEAYRLADRRVETLAHQVTRFVLSANRRWVLIQSGYRLRVLKAGEKADDKGGDAPGRATGYIDWRRIPLLVDPPREWAQMLREAWRLMREYFWTPDMSGIDWDAVFARYANLLPRIATRGELSDLIWEMQGELGTSHAYELGGDYRKPPAYGPGYLGADFAWDADWNGWRITHIVAGDPSVDGHDSPLNAPGVNVREGDVLVAVGGRRATPDATPEALLMRQAEQEVALTVYRPGAGTRTVVVKTLRSERLARYREWVDQNRAFVHRKSGGRVGYIHIPNMMAWGFSEFYRHFQQEVAREALVVDVRFNGGGHVSQLLLEKLARRIIGYDFPRWTPPLPYPLYAPRGPLVALTNDWAGSDGDIFSHGFKLLGLGPLVGRRTWGGVIGIDTTLPLVDKTIVTQPQYAFWFRDVGWDVENYGTDPTIPVEYAPHDYAAGRDPQLEAAVAEAERLLTVQPALVPPDTPRPKKVPPPLPPRPQAGPR